MTENLAPWEPPSSEADRLRRLMEYDASLEMSSRDVAGTEDSDPLQERIARICHRMRSWLLANRESASAVVSDADRFDATTPTAEEQESSLDRDAAEDAAGHSFSLQSPSNSSDAFAAKEATPQNEPEPASSRHEIEQASSRQEPEPGSSRQEQRPSSSRPEPAPSCFRPEPAPDSSQPEPEPVASWPEPEPVSSRSEQRPSSSRPEPAPSCFRPEPAPDSSQPEPEPVSSWPEPEPVSSWPEPERTTLSTSGQHKTKPTTEEPTWESMLSKAPPNPLAAFAVRQDLPAGNLSWDISDLEDGQARSEDAATDRRGENKTRPFDSDEKNQSSHSTTGNSSRMSRWLDGVVKLGFFGLRGCDSNHTVPPNREVDASTGELLPPVEYPDALTSSMDGPMDGPRDIGWRQANMTSTLHIAREIRSRQRLGDKLKETLLESQRFQDLALSPTKEATAIKGEEVGPPFPNARCMVRPATSEDLERILDILQSERSNWDCPQVFRPIKPCLKNVRATLEACDRDKLPFLVAVPKEDDAMDRSKWPKHLEKLYGDFVEFMKRRESFSNTVVGFGFLSDVGNNMLGKCAETRHSAHMQIIVDPRYRRQCYGTALMDRLLLSVSPLHVSLIDYEWSCLDAAGIYESPVRRNDRQLVRIYAATFCESEKEAEHEWRTAMLRKFNFKEVGKLPCVLRSQHGERAWLDERFWVLEAQHLENV
ncbi:hypothetical protein XA68_17779 [Ophiocordyceps unilateralis]|uniref:N-acetyltransferase domain-containing protein n=1 Tax=Ophiocordyceps unilateralis TaxID=268505 RepID=A0A2A9PNP7_OPHUN|nr:hypothetical protein XA68_17779 [Ophiocordyceps unilateralis]